MDSFWSGCSEVGEGWWYPPLFEHLGGYDGHQGVLQFRVRKVVRILLELNDLCSIVEIPENGRARIHLGEWHWCCFGANMTLVVRIGGDHAKLGAWSSNQQFLLRTSNRKGCHCQKVCTSRSIVSYWKMCFATLCCFKWLQFQCNQSIYGLYSVLPAPFLFFQLASAASRKSCFRLREWGVFSSHELRDLHPVHYNTALYYF